MRNQLRRLRRNERGMTFVFVGMGFMAFMAATTLAIDVGMFMTGKSQAQNAADAGALAGAIALGFNDSNDRSSTGPAVSAAISAATSNLMMGAAPSVIPSDVTFPNDPSGNPTRVRVQVFRTTARSNAIPTLIGPIFGVPTVDIGATATAEATPANAATCVKPFMIPDRWREPSGTFNPLTSTFTRYDNQGNMLPANTRDTYVAPGQPGYTGYTSADRGTQLILRAGSGNNVEPTAYQSWKMPGEIGGDFYRDNIAGCNTSVISFSPSQPTYLIQEPGNMVGPTNDGIDRLIAKDPGATWDTSCQCVRGSAFGISPRVTPLPLYDPEYYQLGKVNGRNADFKLAQIMGFFIKERRGNEVYGYISPISGLINPNVGPAPAGAFPIAIRLVQ
jgi:Flp pilus assembly protein TadG